MEQSAIINVTVTQRVEPPPPLDPNDILGWRTRYPETAEVLDRIEALRAQRQEEARKRERVAMARQLQQTPDGRIALAKESARRIRAFDEAQRLARIADGKGAGATEANKQKRAQAREEAMKAAQRKRDEQEAQGRGGPGGGKK